jgi:hypothetical protein
MTSTEKLLVLLGLIAMAFVPGCVQGPDSLTPPAVTRSPYDSSRGDVLFAVAPLVNESGTTVFQPDMVSDALVRSVSAVEGINCLPLNRTLVAMRGMGMRELTSPREVSALADALGVDGLIVGTVTAYDPYDPPTLGLSLALHAGPIGFSGSLNVEELRGTITDPDAPDSLRYVESPIATTSEVFSARNHAVQMEMKRYAEGRSEPSAPRGWRMYQASMPLYTEFVTHAAVSSLLDQERLRLARARRPGSSR